MRQWIGAEPRDYFLRPFVLVGPPVTVTAAGPARADAPPLFTARTEYR